MNEIATIINDNRNILILSHKRPDGDSICSQAALFMVLNQNGFNPYIINQDAVPEMFHFIGIDRYINSHMNGFKADLAIFLDSANRERVGDDVISQLDNLSQTVQCINIDHHTSNDHFCNCNLVRENASSTCEIIYSLIKQMGFNIDKEIATALLTGMITDTGFFKFGNVGPPTLMLAAELLDKGADMKRIAREIYMNRPIEKMHLISTVIERMEVVDDKAYSFITENDFSRTGARSEYTDGIVNQILYIKGIEASVLIIEDDGNVRVSFRSKGSKYDMNKIASKFGGGGHVNAAGAYIKNISIKDAVKKIKSTLVDL